MVAAASVISYNLIYPSPVMVALTGALDVRPIDTLKLAIPLSILLLVAAHFYLSRLHIYHRGWDRTWTPGQPALQTQGLASSDPAHGLDPGWASH